MQNTVYTSKTQRQINRMIPDLVQARELLRDLVLKEFRVQYRYAVMGLLWAVLEPLALTVVLTFVFQLLTKFSIGIADDAATPYPVLLLCGLIFWQYTASALTSATHSLVTHQSLVKKIHFPREVIPLAAMIFPLLNLAIGVLLLLAVYGVMAHRLPLSIALPCFPMLLIIQGLLTLGTGLLLSALQIRFRDIKNLLTVALTFGFYATPIFYQFEQVQRAVEKGYMPEWMLSLYLLNPMAGLITSYRMVLFEGIVPATHLWLWPLIAATLLCLIGGSVFRKLAPTFSDYL